MAKEFTTAEFTDLLEANDLTHAQQIIWGWLLRGDGAAVYRNEEIGHPEMGHLQIVSYGSAAAQIETPEAPTKMPDIGPAINWRYQLLGTYKKRTA